MRPNPYAPSVAIRAILFDLGDTLFRLKPFPEDLRPELARVLSDACPPESVVALADDIHETILEAWRESHGPGLTAEVDNAGTIAQLLEDTEGLANLDVTRLSRRLADVFSKADVGRFDAGEDCGDRVATFLDRGVSLGIVSNTSTRPELLTGFMDLVGLTPSLFRVMLFSVRLGVRKPNPKIYARALAGMGYKPQQTLFVGDRVREDVRGPMAAGMHAALTHEFRREEVGIARPVAVVQELLDVHQVLRDLGV